MKNLKNNITYYYVVCSLALCPCILRSMKTIDQIVGPHGEEGHYVFSEFSILRRNGLAPYFSRPVLIHYVPC
jgi:hypothetical protein